MTPVPEARLADIWLSLPHGPHGPVVLRAAFLSGGEYRVPIEEPLDAQAVAEALQKMRAAILADPVV